MDELGFHGGVQVVLGDPVGDAFREWEVVEGGGEVGDGAFDFEHLVDGSGVAAALGADEADVVRGDCACLSQVPKRKSRRRRRKADDFGGGGEG